MYIVDNMSSSIVSSNLKILSISLMIVEFETSGFQNPIQTNASLKIFLSVRANSNVLYKIPCIQLPGRLFSQREVCKNCPTTFHCLF